MNDKLIVDRTALENYSDKTRQTPVFREDQIELQHHGTGFRATGLPVIQKNLEKSGKGKQVDVPASRQFSGFDVYKKVIDACDLVVIATPPGFRPYHFEAAVEACKHIFMEKPVCVDAAGYNKVIKAAEIADQKKVKVVVGLQRHYQDSQVEHDVLHQHILEKRLFSSPCCEKLR